MQSRYRVVYDEALLCRTGYLAGTDERRAEELNRYLANPDVRAIFCARGGYGVMRILERVDSERLRHDPKIVVGFSDITALLSLCVMAAQVRPIHGPVVTQLGKLPEGDVEWLFRLIENPEPMGRIPSNLARIGARGGGTVEGRLVGGNVELLTRLIGTPWELDLGASVFFLEDVGERPYRIDRMLTQLQLSSALDGVRAVAVGDLWRCEEPDASPPSALDVVEERLAAFRLPGVMGLPVGHGARNLALPVGARCAADLGESELVIEEGAVA